MLICVAASAAAQNASSGLKTASIADISAATSACIASVGPAGTDEKILLAQGWRKATVSSKGKIVATPLSIYGRKNADVVLMTAPGTAASGLCTVTARVEAGGYAAVAQALSELVKKPPFKSTPAESTWLVGPTAVQLAATGDSAKPSVRVSVLHVAEKSK
jgi:hypothetical protein